MLANNWAEMPNYFVTSATESVGRGLLGYIEEVNQEVFKTRINFKTI
jgi:GTP-binding protein